MLHQPGLTQANQLLLPIQEITGMHRVLFSLMVLAGLCFIPSTAQISAAFHDGLAKAIADVAIRSGERSVALTGGCFQNTRLTESTVAALRGAGLNAVWHRRVPPNDGGLALGQAAWASWTGKSGDKKCA